MREDHYDLRDKTHLLKEGLQKSIADDPAVKFARKQAEEYMAKKDVFDFGFTIEEEKPKVDDRAERMFQAIKPLLDNLRQNPEIDTIKWPNRVEKINEFEDKLAKIVEGLD